MYDFVDGQKVTETFVLKRKENDPLTFLLPDWQKKLESQATPQDSDTDSEDLCRITKKLRNEQTAALEHYYKGDLNVHIRNLNIESLDFPWEKKSGNQTP